MTETKPQTEPTMEEILASIRRIISENDEEQVAKKRVEETPEPVVALAHPATSSDEAAAPADTPAGEAEPVIAPGQAHGHPGADSAAVLDLTEMIAEDGTVVHLFTGPSDRETVVTVETVVVESQPEDGEPVVTQMAEQIPAERTPEEQPAFSPETAQHAESTMENTKDNSAGFGASSAKPGSDESLVSSNTAAAATATFAQLARSIAQEPQSSGNVAIGTGATLEDMVREMIRPMLKTWLDQNLPKMVEHMVRRELDRMVRRAEDV